MPRLRAAAARRLRSTAVSALAVLLFGTGPLAAQTSRFRLWTDPVVASVGQPVRALVDLRGNGEWCYYQSGGVEVAGPKLILHLPFPIYDPPIGCPPPGAPPAGIFSFDLPPAALGVGFHPIWVDESGPEPAAIGGIHVVPNATQLELQSGQFAVTARFLDPRTGVWSDAHAAPLSAETGTFWFFSDRNQELQIKVLDGRTVNGQWWVFLASQTTLEATIEVTHRTLFCTQGANPLPCPRRTYPHPAGAAHNVQDVNGFPDEP